MCLCVAGMPLKCQQFSKNVDSCHDSNIKTTMKWKQLSSLFRSIKPHKNPNPNSNPPKLSISPNHDPSSSASSSSPLKSKLSLPSKKKKQGQRSWCVYLIASTNPPIKTYVGVTTDFPRRLKQHNGELNGGAKASRAGRPWICACLVQGFTDRSEACKFESNWKIFSRKLPRRRKLNDTNKQVDEGSLLLLQHRQAALDRVKHSSACGHLEIDWQLKPP
ncbi:hypothetical protein Drorol1_Dr00016016 [Drosera rotundifolia]